MLELGPQAPALHAALAEPVAENGIDRVFAAGALMENLWEALPAERRGGYAPTAAELEPAVLAEIRAGDAIMIKGSNSVRMGRIVQALKHRYGAQAGITSAAAQG
jgi:UDP-N-acetylmuramoyl-tripeptide--D-alanyl-D-alanine ligase